MLRAAANPALFPICLCLLSWLPSPAHAVDVERRDFTILVDGKEHGQSRMTITVQDDGVTVMQGSAAVKFSKLLFSVTFQIEATEWWKDGKLIGLKSKSSENSKKNDISAASDGTYLRTKVNGVDRQTRTDVWTTSYWKLADARYHNKPIPLFDPEDGKEYNGQLQFVGNEQLTIANQPMNCYHFKISGASTPVDLWYDRYHRVVRQEWTEQGHRVIVQLVNVQR